jgi:hypothetical protein
VIRAVFVALLFLVGWAFAFVLGRSAGRRDPVRIYFGRCPACSQPFAARGEGTVVQSIR